jgi:hypothetical protein
MAVLALAFAMAGTAAPVRAMPDDGPPLLAGAAFVPADACALDPFAPADLQGIERRLQDRCRVAGGPLALDGSGGWRSQGDRAEGRLDHELSLQHASWRARVRLGLAAGLGRTGETAALTAQALVAAGLWWQPDRRWAVQWRFGERHDGDGGGGERRLSLTGVWRPTAAHMIVSRWQSDGEDDAVHELGLRWWLQRERLSLDLAVPTSGEASGQTRMRLAWRGFSL